MIVESMKLDDRFAKVNNNFITDKRIDSTAIVVYTVMKTLMYDFSNECAIVPLSGLYELLGVTSNQTKPTNAIKEAIEYLVEHEYITLHDMFHNKIEFNPKSNRTYKVSFNDDNIDDGGWTPIPKYNLCTLLEYIIRNKDKGIHKYKLIKYYLVIARQCSNSACFGYITMKSLCNRVSITDKTCSDWNMILHELGIIEYNNEYGHLIDGEFKMDCTMFGHYNVVLENHTELTLEGFNYLVDDRVKSNKVVKVDKDAINNKRSIAKKKYWEEVKAQEEIVEVKNEAPVEEPMVAEAKPVPTGDGLITKSQRNELIYNSMYSRYMKIAASDIDQEVADELGGIIMLIKGKDMASIDIIEAEKKFNDVIKMYDLE